MPQTVPANDIILNHTNDPSSPAYSASRPTRVFAEEMIAIRGRLVSAQYSANPLDLYIGGTETISPTRQGYLTSLEVTNPAVGEENTISTSWTSGLVVGDRLDLTNAAENVSVIGRGYTNALSTVVPLTIPAGFPEGVVVGVASSVPSIVVREPPNTTGDGSTQPARVGIGGVWDPQGLLHIGSTAGIGFPQIKFEGSFLLSTPEARALEVPSASEDMHWTGDSGTRYKLARAWEGADMPVALVDYQDGGLHVQEGVLTTGGVGFKGERLTFLDPGTLTEWGALNATADGSYTLSPTGATSAVLDLNGDSNSGLLINGSYVMGEPQPAVPDASGGATVDTEARAAINTLLARCRWHGFILT